MENFMDSSHQSLDKQVTKYPILNSIFNQSALDAYQSKYRKFFLLFTLFYCIMFLLILMIEPAVDSLVKYMTTSHCQDHSELCIIKNGVSSGLAIAIFVFYNFCIKPMAIAFAGQHLYGLFYESRKEPSSLTSQFNSYFFQKIMQLSNFSDNDKYLFKLQLAGYISKSDIKSIQSMLENHQETNCDSNYCDLEVTQAIHIALNKLENMFKNKTFVDVSLVSETIGKITKQYKQQDNIKRWITHLYKQYESTLTQQKEQFNEVLSLNLNSLDVIDFHDVQFITSLDDVSMFVLDYIKCHGDNESVTYRYIKDIFKEHIIKNNDNVLKKSLDKLLNVE